MRDPVADRVTTADDDARGRRRAPGRGLGLRRAWPWCAPFGSRRRSAAKPPANEPRSRECQVTADAKARTEDAEVARSSGAGDGGPHAAALSRAPALGSAGW